VFAIGEWTIHDILCSIVPAIIQCLGYNIRWPTRERLRKVTIEFQQKQGLPNCIGAMDKTHIEIRIPTNYRLIMDCRIKKGNYSVLFQGVVESRCCFTSIHTNICGLVHNA
jgi:hypothetical protein